VSGCAGKTRDMRRPELLGISTLPPGILGITTLPCAVRKKVAFERFN